MRCLRLAARSARPFTCVSTPAQKTDKLLLIPTVAKSHASKDEWTKEGSFKGGATLKPVSSPGCLLEEICVKGAGEGIVPALSDP